MLLQLLPRVNFKLLNVIPHISFCTPVKSGVVFFLTIVNQLFVYERHSKISFLNQDTGDSRNFICGQPYFSSLCHTYKGRNDKLFFSSNNSGIHTEDIPWRVCASTNLSILTSLKLQNALKF